MPEPNEAGVWKQKGRWPTNIAVLVQLLAFSSEEPFTPHVGPQVTQLRYIGIGKKDVGARQSLCLQNQRKVVACLVICCVIDRRQLIPSGMQVR